MLTARHDGHAGEKKQLTNITVWNYTEIPGKDVLKWKKMFHFVTFVTS